MKRAFPRQRQRGAIAVEAALGLPLLVGVALVGSDMYRIGIERAQIEQAAGVAALTVAAQSSLTAAGFEALNEALTLGRPQDYQVVVMNVLQSGRIGWALQRGDKFCSIPSDGRDYAGDLPEAAPDDDTDEASMLSMVVVQVCRDTSEITLAGGIALPEVLGTRSIHRAVAQAIELDETLTEESQANGLSTSE